MTTTQDGISRCTLYRGRGMASELTNELAATEDREFPYRAPVADRVSLRTIMTRDLICARPDLDIATVVSLMVDRHVGCIPIVDEHQRPIGVITKFDLVEQLDAALRGSSCGCPPPSDVRAETANDVMMPLALTLHEHATIAHAAAMMMSENTHHVLVVDEKEVLVGVVSAKDIVGWVMKHDVLAVRRDASCGPPVWRPFDS